MTDDRCIVGELATQAILISRDVRPAAMEAVQDRYLDEARAIAKNHGLRLLAYDLSVGWKEVWIYKHPHVGLVIDRTSRQPANGFEHWVLGKLFGYSEQSIADYLLRAGLLQPDYCEKKAAVEG